MDYSLIYYPQDTLLATAAPVTQGQNIADLLQVMQRYYA